MANIKSAKKRIKVINTKTERNKAIKTKVKTYIKKVEAAIAANDKAAASEALTACISEISKATSKGIFPRIQLLERLLVYLKPLTLLLNQISRNEF